MKHSPFLWAWLVALPLCIPAGAIVYLITGNGMLALWTVAGWEFFCALLMPLVIALDNAN